MHYGVLMFPADYAIPITELGRAAEDLGFESLFFPEHTHIPASRRSPWPGGPELPKEYSHTLDPFVAMGAVAAVTKTLKVGTGICLVVERDPITLAKEVASVDHLSGGRMLFGIGGGWNYEEMENHGTKPALRWKIMRERILAMKRIWTDDNAEYHGKYVDFDPIWAWPKPAQKPHPPILVGGDGPRTLERVVEYGDEWMPIPGRGGDLAPRIAELQQMAKAAGRGPIPVSLFGVPPGAEFVERLATLEGVHRILFGMPPAPAEQVLPMLREAAKVAGL
ncbi:MAG TPA: LLM class F420-dependent oxidoreductase [Dehalococcoidia bacterium]|nr:LLM class F420-dependent oxidoreductase [Dehalococcoidia bacterium]